MAEERPLIDVITDEVTTAIFQRKISMTARSEVMKESHVRETVRGVLAMRWPTVATPEPCSCESDKPGRATRMASDEAWLAQLEREPALQGIDVRKELGRCQFWCRNNDRLCTRKTFQNWLLKADRTITVNGSGQSSRVVVSMDPAIEPKCDWRSVLMKMGADAQAVKDRAWLDLNFTTRSDVLKAIR